MYIYIYIYIYIYTCIHIVQSQCLKEIETNSGLSTVCHSYGLAVSAEGAKNTFFFNWYSLHARLNSHYEAWSYKEKKHKKVKAYMKSN